VLSDLDSDVLRLGTLDAVTGAFRPATPKMRWEVRWRRIHSDEG
jgi:hypothetical protein